MSIREKIEHNESLFLASQAARSAGSQSRRFPEQPHHLRTAYQRDRDRIVHTKAFRRLAHKTQVFPAPQDDHHRVRLTHTLEVTQVARTVARALALNEDLAEAICLGHDLGHTPFGHLGEEVLTEFLGRPFRHNEQSVRVVDHLQWRGDSRGLNLTWEVRDGILNHTWSMPVPGTLEGQVARFADRIAYLSHDIDDAIRAGVLTLHDLPDAANQVLGTSSSSRIDAMVNSLVAASADLEAIRVEPHIFEVMAQTRRFMFERVYRSPMLLNDHIRIRKLLMELLFYYRDHPGELPGEGSADFQTRLVDYVSGMTDRFAIREHQRLFASERV
ncbi:MAG: deoxyguanosinetriphosphate triphosphohydrolase [Actinomycetota bacterium]